MQKNSIIIGIILLSSLLFWSCEDKFSNGDFALYSIESPDTLIIPTFDDIGKKGIVLPQFGSDWSAKVSSVKPHWHFSGSSKISIKEPGNVDFVPMISDTADMNDEVFEHLLKLKDQDILKYLLTFDEPDNPEMANLTVDEAIELWPQLEQIGVPLVSPICVDASDSWMEEFMDKAEQEGLRVDFVGVQWAGSDDVEAFFSELEAIYNSFGKPIWLTRFTLVNTKLKDVITFLETTLPILDELDYIYRYAWQTGGINTGTALWDDLGGLTTRGQLYANHQANSFISNGRDDRIDFENLQNLVINGGFETGDMTGWGGYGTEMETEDVNSGDFAGKAGITGWDSGSALNYELQIEPGNTYYLSCAIKWVDVITAPAGFEGLRIVLRDEDKTIFYDRIGPITSTEWTTVTAQVDIPAGSDPGLFIAWWRPKLSPELLVDDFFFAKIE